MTSTASRRSGGRRVGIVWCLAVLLLGICVGPAAADVGGVCRRAGDLTTSGLPQRALALLERLNDAEAEQGCVARRRGAALERIGRAEVLVGYAGGAPGGSRPSCAGELPRDPSSDDWREGARACDADNEAAAVTSASQDAETRLRQAVTSHVQPWEYGALALLAVLVVGVVAARLLQRTFPLETLKRWRNAARLPKGMAVPWAALVLASVLLVPAVTWISGLGVLGVVLTVAATVLWGLAVLLLAWTAASRMRLFVTVRGKEGEDKLATAHVLALLGELGSEAPQGLETVVGTDVTALEAAGLVTAPQGKLASTVFQLLSVVWRQAPWEVVVSVVSDDLHTVHISRNGRHVRSAVVDRFALGLGSPCSTAEEPAPRRPDLHRMTAAVVLCALHEAYGFSGLAGATSWRSVGLQYIATTDYAGEPAEWELLARAVDDDPDNDAALLALWHARFRRATRPEDLGMYVRLLGDWLTACTTVRTTTGETSAAGGSTSPSTKEADVLRAARATEQPVPDQRDGSALSHPRLTGTAARLRSGLQHVLGLRQDQSPKPALDAALLMRAQYAFVVASVNLHYAALLEEEEEAKRSAAGAAQTPSTTAVGGRPAPGPDAAGGRDGAWEKIDAEVERLRELIETHLGGEQAPWHALASRLKEPLAALCAMSGRSTRETPAPRSPTGHYQHACWLGTESAAPTEAARSSDGRARSSATRPDYQQALRHLHLADASPELAAWRDADPQLKRLQQQDAYRERYGRDPVAALADTPTFAPYADRLRLLRITGPEHVLDHDRQGTLGAVLGVTPAVAWRLARFAALAHSVRHGLPRFDVAEALTAAGVLDVTPNERPDLVPYLLSELSGLKHPPAQTDLEAWLGTAREPAMSGAR